MLVACINTVLFKDIEHEAHRYRFQSRTSSLLHILNNYFNLTTNNSLKSLLKPIKPNLIAITTILNIAQ